MPRTNMVKYIFKRILVMIPILLTVLIITFFLSRLMDILPVIRKVGFHLDREELQRLIDVEKKRMGYDLPIYVQLFIYLKNFASGNWGTSYIIDPDEPVLEFIVSIIPKTIELMIIPMIIVPIIAVKLGVISASNKDKSKDTIIRFFAILGGGFPIFFVANVLQFFIGKTLVDFTYGEFDFEIIYANTPGLRLEGEYYTGFRLIDSIINNDQLYLMDTLIHLILPTIAMSITSLAGITRQTRSSMLDVLDQDYIRTARAKGVLEKNVINKHALRNALIPTSNLIIGGIAASLLGSLFIERTFDYLGFGYYFVSAVFAADYLLINGFLVFSAIIIISGNLIADVMYTIIDPRIIYT
ncbi:MAG: ABC transporter permease [Candidatus Hermodarchaeota archaeon]